MAQQSSKIFCSSSQQSLTFSSTKNNVLGGQVRSTTTPLSSIIIEDKPKLVNQKDHIKPIFIYEGQDTFCQIGVSSQGSISGLQVLRRQLGVLSSESCEKKELAKLAKVRNNFDQF